MTLREEIANTLHKNLFVDDDGQIRNDLGCADRILALFLSSLPKERNLENSHGVAYAIARSRNQTLQEIKATLRGEKCQN